MPLVDVRWGRPVRVRLQCGLEHTFTSIFDAVDFLETEWPIRRGQPHEQAVKRCRRALSGIIPAAIARAFVAACMEAGLPMVKPSPKSAPSAGVPTPWSCIIAGGRLDLGAS
ncbi:Protein of unknown function (DUF982) [Rhizobium leguminosarum bv. trifolii WSM597]|uniref:DUF982 domain-containing protein n=1 Tax=Rhizobium leguminosarum bv. trifolii WSM597 TaxID=754764 RepID=I9NDS4_RHILT|nr:DUF982 domain-containing protein [Rhizobium leguminosarum]EJB06064.1 Protein of unknown function (DUF982) [Rhizobium leguminosarum bv. trifolii WSM597]